MKKVMPSFIRAILVSFTVPSGLARLRESLNFPAESVLLEKPDSRKVAKAPRVGKDKLTV